MTEPTRPTSQSISSYARTARRAVRLQLIVAGLALLATIVFGVMITGQTAKLNAVNAELKVVEGQFKAASSRLETADRASKAVLQAVSALASRDDALYSAAIQSLETARERLGIGSINLETETPEATLFEFRRAHHNVSRTLASLLSTRPSRGPEDLGKAIVIEIENLTQPTLTSQEKYDSTIALAGYHCADGNSAAAKALLDQTFLSENPGATRDSTLLDACKGLFDLPKEVLARFDPSTADPQFRVRRIFLHIVTAADLGPAQVLGRSLCAAGYAVPRIELVSKAAAPKDNQVRYYYPPQASEAEWIASRFAEQANRSWTWTPPAIRQLTGFDDLDPQNIEIWLVESPRANGVQPRPQPATQNFSCTPANEAAAADVSDLLAKLISDDRTSRVSAGQLVADLLRSDNDNAMIAALISQLQPPRLEQLSAAGRLNVLYMLNLEPAWQSRSEAQQLQQAIATVRSRASQGIAIGGQTNDCLVKLEAKLKGETSSDRCGGL